MTCNSRTSSELIRMLQQRRASHAPSRFKLRECTNYRELQILAKMRGLPCNLKKADLRLVIEAKLSGDEERVAFLLKQVKSAREERKREKERLALQRFNLLYLSNRHEENLRLASSTHDRVKTKAKFQTRDTKLKIREELLERMVKETTCRNVTFRQTQVNTHYQAYIDPANTSSPIGLPQHLPQSMFVNNRSDSSINGFTNRWNTPATTQVNTHHQAYVDPANTSTSTLPQHDSQRNLFANHCDYLPENSLRQLWTAQAANNAFPQFQACSSSGSSSIGHPIQQATGLVPPGRHECKVHNSDISAMVTRYPFPPNEGIACCTNYGNLVVPLGQSYLNSQPTERYTSINSWYQPKLGLPKFETLRRPSTTGRISPQPSVSQQNHSTALECLANTAVSIHENVNLKQENVERNSREEGTQRAGYNNNIEVNELVMSDTKTSTQDVPTWNNYLIQLANNNNPTVSSTLNVLACKYHCHAVLDSTDKKFEHEQHCHLQAITCPLPFCKWTNQLKFLDMHVFSNHYPDIVVSSDATFCVRFGITPVEFRDGPNRLCFLQMVNHRLFITIVIVNFQNMQVYIYTQYLNDYSYLKSTAAIEVSRQDGVRPYQWTGRVFPYTFSPLRLVARQCCIKFKLDSNCLLNNFKINVKIRNHGLHPN